MRGLISSSFSSWAAGSNITMHGSQAKDMGGSPKSDTNLVNGAVIIYSDRQHRCSLGGLARWMSRDCALCMRLSDALTCAKPPSEHWRCGSAAICRRRYLLTGLEAVKPALLWAVRA